MLSRMPYGQERISSYSSQIANATNHNTQRGCLEFYGGFVQWLLQRGPLESGIIAMTIGHTILGQSPAALDISRDHEHVHVQQYERWGPFFLPAYFGCSLYMWLNKKDPYRDNPFEIEAYRIADITVHPE